MTKKINKLDIALHTVPTVVVGVTMGFMAAFGLLSITRVEQVLWFGISAIATLAFSYMWVSRERRQHEGHLGGQQSVLEAIVPLISGPIAFLVSTTLFYFYPL